MTTIIIQYTYNYRKQYWNKIIAKEVIEVNVINMDNW